MYAYMCVYIYVHYKPICIHMWLVSGFTDNGQEQVEGLGDLISWSPLPLSIGNLDNQIKESKRVPMGYQGIEDLGRYST